MKNFFSFLSKFSHKKIICFDGGGVRTIAALVFLKNLKQKVEKKFLIFLICSSEQVPVLLMLLVLHTEDFRPIRLKDIGPKVI